MSFLKLNLVTAFHLFPCLYFLHQEAHGRNFAINISNLIKKKKYINTVRREASKPFNLNEINVLQFSPMLSSYGGAVSFIGGSCQVKD